MMVLAMFTAYTFIHFCLIAEDLVPITPLWLVIIYPFVTAYKYMQLEDAIGEVTKDDFKELLIDIRQGQFQSFKEKIEDRPELLKAQYQGHSLLYWCKKYHSLKANQIIIDLMKKSS